MTEFCSEVVVDDDPTIICDKHLCGLNSWIVSRSKEGACVRRSGLAEADEPVAKRMWEDANASWRLCSEAGTPLRQHCLPTELRMRFVVILAVVAVRGVHPGFFSFVPG